MGRDEGFGLAEDPPGCGEVWLLLALSWTPFFMSQCGHQAEDFGKARNSTNAQFIVFQVQNLSNLALTDCRKDFLLFAAPGRTRFESQNTYSFSFMKLPLKILPSLTAQLQHFDILLQEKAATIT